MLEMQKSSLSAKRNFRSFSLWSCHWKKHFRFAFARFCVAKLINFRFLSEHSFCVLSWALTVLSTAYNIGTCDQQHNWHLKISEQNVWITFLRCCRSRVYFVQLFRYISLSLLSRIRLASLSFRSKKSSEFASLIGSQVGSTTSLISS